MRISAWGEVKAARTRPAPSTSSARVPPVPTSIPSQYIRQIGRAVETRFVAERRLLDARFRSAISKRSPPALVDHDGGELVPGAEHSSAEQVERKVQDIDHAGERDS